MIKDNSGQPKEVTPGSFGLDCTLPEVRNWIGQLFAKVSKKWGYDYFKLDFLTYGVGGSHSNTEVTKGKALRLALKTIRESVGEKKFINITGPISVGLGLADGSRLGYDVWPSWEGIVYWGMGIKPCVRAAAVNYYLNNRVYRNDPDCLVTSSPQLSLDQARAWASLIALSGGMIFLSDDLTKLASERVKIATKILPSYGKSARLLDLFEREYPGIWHLKVRKNFDSWDVLGLFNWDYTRSHMEVSFKELGLEPNEDYLEVSEFQ